MNKLEFGKRLAELRNAKGLSARDMSLSMGQGNAYINNIENGNNYPSMETFFYICETLNVTPSEFFELENKNPEKLKGIVEAMKGLDDKQLDLIKGIIASFK